MSSLEHGCEWCEGPLPPGSRKDRKTCSKRCRQAKARFKIRRASIEKADRPMRFAYADPPYPGLARKYYGEGAEEVDHAELVSRLTTAGYDGWALSTSAAALRDVWNLCPPDTRLCIFVNGPRKTKAYSALHAYEALLVWGGRKRRVPVVEDLSDVLSWGGRQHSHPGALVGMKPAPFCNWLFELLGAAPGDELDDFFPGSGAVTRAWQLYTAAPGDRDTSRRDPDDPSRGQPEAVAAADLSRVDGGEISGSDPPRPPLAGP